MAVHAGDFLVFPVALQGRASLWGYQDWKGAAPASAMMARAETEMAKGTMRRVTGWILREIDIARKIMAGLSRISREKFSRLA
jgi:hypothetical protein